MRRANKGKGLETLILSSQGDVQLIKVPHAVRYIPGGKTVATAAPVDFVGLYLPTKRLILMDAKQCDLVRRFPVGNRTHVAPHQIAELVRFGRAGAIAGLLVESTRHRRLYWCDWSLLVNVPPSYPWEALADLGPSTHAIRWQRVVEAAERAREAA